MVAQNQIVIEKRGTVTLLDVKGDLTSSSESLFNETYGGLDPGQTQIILIKFEKNAYINSGGIAVLIQTLAQTQRNKQRIGLTGLSEHFKKIFRMVGITKFAAIYSTIDEAVQSLSG